MHVCHCTTKLLGGGGVYWFHSVRPSVRPACRVHPVTSTVMDSFFSYKAQMITTIRGCVTHHDLWPWLRKSCPLCSVYSSGRILFIFAQRIISISGCLTLFSESGNFEFLANFGKFLGLDLEKKSTILLAFFPYLTQIIISIRGCVTCNDLWPWPICSRSFGLDLENHVRSVASTVLDGFFPYLVQIITCMRGVSHMMTFDLDLYLQGHSTLTLKIVSVL